MADPLGAIAQLPVPQEKSIEGGLYSTAWKVTMNDLPPNLQLLAQLQSLDKQLSVSIQPVKDLQLTITSTRGPRTSYTDAYFATWFAIARLEQTAGPIASIQGLPREDWQLLFVMVEHLLSLPGPANR